MKTTFLALVNNSSLTASIPLKDIFSDQGVIPEGSVIELGLLDVVFTYPVNKVKIRNIPILKQSADSYYIKGAVAVIDDRFSGITVCIRDGDVVLTFDKLRNSLITEFEISGEVTVIPPKKKVIAIRPEVMDKGKKRINVDTIRIVKTTPDFGSIIGSTYKVTSYLETLSLETKEVYIPVGDHEQGEVTVKELQEHIRHRAEKFLELHAKTQIEINRAMFRGTEEEFMEHYDKAYHYVEV